METFHLLVPNSAHRFPSTSLEEADVPGLGSKTITISLNQVLKSIVGDGRSVEYRQGG